MLSLQLLLACSLDVLDVILELISFYLYSPVSCRKELKNLLEGMGLHDPDGLLFKEIMTWVEDLKFKSKDMIRTQCQQKLEEIFLQVWWAKGWWFTYWKPIHCLLQRPPRRP